MATTSKEARAILEKAREGAKYTTWIDHSISVGDSAGRIAKALKDRGIDVNVDLAIACGYVHDIGKASGGPHGHAIRGYEYLKKLGYMDIADVCLTHSYLNNDIYCTAGGEPDEDKLKSLGEFIKNHQYTLEEKIINLCDLMCPPAQTVYTMDKRLIDIIIRRGAHSNTQYHVQEAYKLKEYFDNLLGFNLYDLFPEIKDNL